MVGKQDPKNPDIDSTFKYSPQLLEKCFIGDIFPVLFLVNPIIAYHLDENKKVYDCNIPVDKPILYLEYQKCVVMAVQKRIIQMRN